MKKIILVFLLYFGFGYGLYADKFSKFSLIAENDLFAGEDHGYTHGTKFLLSSYEVETPEKFKIRNHGISQFIYTPRYIDIAEPQLNDRPWAGLLLYEYMSYKQEDSRFSFKGWNVGVIGPMSGSEISQKKVHEMIDAQEPLGWDNQLENQLAVGYLEGKGLFYVKNDSVEIGQDFSYLVGSYAGNVGTSFFVRLGNRLPEQQVFARMEPYTRDIENKSIGDFLDLPFMVYIGTESRYVFYNELITGGDNDITLANYVYDFFAGINVSIKSVNIGYQYTMRGKEFKEDSAFNIFGRITISYKF